MLDIHFYTGNNLEKTSLDMVVYLFGIRYKVPTKISIEKQYWNSKKQRLKLHSQSPENAAINKRLDCIEKDCRAACEKIRLKTPQYTSDEVKAILRAVIAPNGMVENMPFTKFVRLINTSAV